MRTKENTSRELVEKLGSAMMLSWVLTIGLVDAVALLAASHAIFTQNLMLGIVAGILVFIPVVLTMAWGLFAWTTAREEIRHQPRRVSVNPPFQARPSKAA